MAQRPERLGSRSVERGRRWEPLVLRLERFRLIVSPLELLLLVLVIAIFVRSRLAGQPVKPRLGALRLPLLVFAGCVAFGVVNGLTHGAQFNIALWEVRGFLMLVLVFFLASILIREEAHVNQLIWTVMIAVTGLALENTLRWLLIVRTLNVADDLAYDHIDGVILGFAIVLCLCLLLIGGTRSQRAYAIFLLPLLIFVIEVMPVGARPLRSCLLGWRSSSCCSSGCARS